MSGSKISYKRNGDRYYREKNYAQALIWYNLGLQINPYNYNLMISAANAYFKMFDTRTALPLYYKAIKKANKIKTFQIIINKIKRGQYIDYNLFKHRLLKIHKIMIEPWAIPFIITYIQDIQQIERLEKKFERFKEIFEKNPIKDLNDLIDGYILYCNLYPYQQNIYMLQRIAYERGYPIDINQLVQTIENRRQYWNQLYTTNQDVMPLITMMDKTTGEEFEKLIKIIFQMRGYQCKITKKSKDKGGDIIARNPYETIAIQCKRWNQKIGTDAVQQAHAAKTIYRTTRAMVITNNYFTKDAIKNAQMLNIELWDRNQLIKTLQNQLK